VEKVCRELGISAATFFNVEAEVWWDDHFGKRLRALESENARLKKLLSERTLELDALQDVLKKY
jgi:putative transposase